jgi:hypothetical protein
MTGRCATSKQVVVGNNAVVVPDFEGTTIKSSLLKHCAFQDSLATL